MDAWLMRRVAPNWLEIALPPLFCDAFYFNTTAQKTPQHAEHVSVNKVNLFIKKIKFLICRWADGKS